MAAIRSWLHGGFDFSDCSSAKWIFDIEIEKLRAHFFLHGQKAKIVLGVHGKPLIDRSRQTFYKFIFKFPVFPFHDFFLLEH